jgi:hypothetical protein
LALCVADICPGGGTCIFYAALYPKGLDAAHSSKFAGCASKRLSIQTYIGGYAYDFVWLYADDFTPESIPGRP